ncbi:MAG: hemolysin family protein [Pirellulales bacterium]
MNTAVGLAVASLCVACLAAIAAQSLRQFSRRRLEEMCRPRQRDRLFGQILLHHDRTALGADLLFIVAASAYAASIARTLSMRTPPVTTGQWASVLGVILLAFVLLVAAAHWLPNALRRVYGEWFLVHTWGLWRCILWALTPLVWGADFVNTVVHRLAGRPQRPANEDDFEEEIRAIVTEGHREGLLEEDAREMIEGVIELSDADVSEIMTPRTDMVCMNVGLNLDEALQFINDVGHSRIPVYGKNRDDIVGILYTKDLLPWVAAGEDLTKQPIADIMREPYFVPETKPLDALLKAFQQTRNHMAVVLDEYGGVSGVVTIEDVLEEIVGEIVDEHDEDLVEGIRMIDERTSESMARVHVDEINDRLGLKLDEDGDFDTIGGFVFSELGHIPNVGESVVRGNVRITVLEVTRRRIERVRIERLDEQSDDQQIVA